ncbi:2965_t:CDS:2, partial [Scutellospora calospora]
LFSFDSVVNSQEETIPRNSAGRPQKEVWDYIQKVALKDQCTKVSIEVKQKFLHIVVARNHTKENDNERDTEEDFPIFKKACTKEPQELNN